MKKVSSEKVVQVARRKTRRKFSSEEKIRIVLEGLRGEESATAAMGFRLNRETMTLSPDKKWTGKIAAFIFHFFLWKGSIFQCHRVLKVRI